MTIELNKQYKIRISLNNKDLNYIATVTAIDDNFISFIDKNGDKYNYNIACIISYKSLEVVE